MYTGVALHSLDLFASFFFRALVGYAFCLALSWVCFRPNVRFLVWMSFLVAAGLYWIFLIVHAVDYQSARLISVRGAASSFPSSSVGVTNWTIPASWGGRLGVAAGALAWCYVAGALILLLLAVRNRTKLWFVLRDATPVSGELDQTFVQLCDRLRVRCCRLFVLRGLTSPATAYSWRPRILLPESLQSYLDDEQLEDVLCHELMHVKRRDYLWATISELTRCLLFFHPAVWLALRHLRQQRELACDAAVVRQREDRRPEYAECLTRLARVRLAEERAFVPINFAGSASFLATRVRSVLAEKHSYPWWKQGAAFAAIVPLLAVFVVLWPALAIVLRLAPRVAGEGLKPPARVVSTKLEKVRPQRRVRSSGPPLVVAHVPTLRPSEDISSLPSLLLSPGAGESNIVSMDIPWDSNNATMLPSPESNSEREKDSARNQTPAVISSPPVSATPVWTESPPLKRAGSSSSWRSALAGLAVATLGRIARQAGAEGQDLVQSQEGNHFLTLPGGP
jgi:beta-lactamase regulating signal transducer with metallopeptidase domain